MVPDPNRPEKLLAVANEIEATAITSALAEYGVEAFAVGGYTAGFKAEAPGTVAVMVRHADFDRAKQALTETRQQQGKIDWSNVDVMEGAEQDPPAETADIAPDWSPLRNRLWLILELFLIAVCLIIGLFTGFTEPLIYAIMAIVLIGLVLVLRRFI